jgi:hypothetical protein
MEQSPYQEADCFSTINKFFGFYVTRTLSCYKTPPLDSIMSQLNSLHVPLQHFVTYY